MKPVGVLVVFIALLVAAYLTGIRREIPNNEITNNMDAAEVMSHVVQAYRSFSTYSDKGTSVVHLASADHRVEFETLFKRPGRLRFAWTVEYSQPPGFKQNGLIWSDGTTARARYSVHDNKVEAKKNLDLAVAGAIAASWGTAPTILRLLTDEITTVRLDELNRLRMIGTETADEVDCFVLVGYFATGEECKVWVGRGDYLIRRLEERSESLKREEVRTQIMVNQRIPDSRFIEKGH